MVRQSRAGFELSINTLVVIILGIAIIAGGIVLISRLTSSSEQVADDLTAEQRGELQNLMREGQLVAFYPAVQTVRTGESVTFALGVKNNLDQEMTVLCDDPTVFEIIGPDEKPSTDLTVLCKPPTVKAGEQAQSIALITAKDTAALGTYTIVFRLRYIPTGNSGPEKEIYDSPRFVTLKVE
jgi:hypothetical protein